MAPEPGFTSDGYNTLILKDEQSDWQNNEWALLQYLIRIKNVRKCVPKGGTVVHPCYQHLKTLTLFYLFIYFKAAKLRWFLNYLTYGSIVSFTD